MRKKGKENKQKIQRTEDNKKEKEKRMKTIKKRENVGEAGRRKPRGMELYTV